MKIQSCLFAAVVMGGMLQASPGSAYDLTGVWASDSSNCQKIFARKGTSITYQKNADMYGSGFIVEKNIIRGRSTRCRINTQKEDGALVHFLASCSNDVMLSNVQLSVRVKDQDTIVRLFPGISEMALQYSRCSLP